MFSRCRYVNILCRYMPTIKLVHLIFATSQSSIDTKISNDNFFHNRVLVYVKCMYVVHVIFYWKIKKPVLNPRYFSFVNTKLNILCVKPLIS